MLLWSQEIKGRGHRDSESSCTKFATIHISLHAHSFWWKCRSHKV